MNELGRWIQSRSSIPHLLSPTNLATALIAINLIVFAAFGQDKDRRGHYRIAESTLLLFAFLGGTLGAYAGRSAFRHKTRKQPFNSNLFTIAVLQMLALGGLIGWWLIQGYGHRWNSPQAHNQPHRRIVPPEAAKRDR